MASAVLRKEKGVAGRRRNVSTLFSAGSESITSTFPLGMAVVEKVPHELAGGHEGRCGVREECWWIRWLWCRIRQI